MGEIDIDGYLQINYCKLEQSDFNILCTVQQRKATCSCPMYVHTAYSRKCLVKS